MRLEPNRLVFVDETGTTTKMTRLRGRARRGERVKASARRADAMPSAVRPELTNGMVIAMSWRANSAGPAPAGGLSSSRTSSASYTRSA